MDISKLCWRLFYACTIPDHSRYNTQTDAVHVHAPNDAASSMANDAPSVMAMFSLNMTREATLLKVMAPGMLIPDRVPQSNHDHTSNQSPTSLHGSTSNLHRSSSQVSLNSPNSHDEAGGK